MSVLQKAFYRRVESLGEDTENTLAKVILDLPTAELSTIAQEAQHVWVHAFGRARATDRKKRVDTGVTRPRTTQRLKAYFEIQIVNRFKL